MISNKLPVIGPKIHCKFDIKNTFSLPILSQILTKTDDKNK